MNKEDLYNKKIIINIENFVEIKTILFELGFVWCSTGKDYILYRGYDEIILLKDATYETGIIAIYKKDILFFGERHNEFIKINGDDIIKKFKRDKKIKMLL